MTSIERINQINNGTETNKMKSIRLSTLFNMAYWHESSHQYDQANNLYKEIINEHPDYIDAYLRLAYLAKKRGDTHRAIHWIDEASKSKAKAPVN